MSSFGSQMRKRLEELRKAGENVPQIMAEVAEGATIEAVRVATEKTPPNDGTLAGTNMRSRADGTALGDRQCDNTDYGRRIHNHGA